MNHSPYKTQSKKIAQNQKIYNPTFVELLKLWIHVASSIRNVTLDCRVAELLAMTNKANDLPILRHSLLLIKRIQQFEQVSALAVVCDDVGEEVGAVLFSGGVAHEGVHEPGVVHEMLKNVAGKIDPV